MRTLLTILLFLPALAGAQQQTRATGLDLSSTSSYAFPASAPVMISSLTVSSSAWVAGSVTAAKFYGDGRALTLPAASTYTLVSNNLALGSVGAIPYQVSAGNTSFLPVGPFNALLQGRGAAAPVWTSSPAITGQNITLVPISALSAGILPTTVPASSVTVTGVAAGVYGGPGFIPQVTVRSDGRIGSATQVAVPALSSTSVHYDQSYDWTKYQNFHTSVTVGSLYTAGPINMQGSSIAFSPAGAITGALNYIQFNPAWLDGTNVGRLQLNTEGFLEYGMPGGSVNLSLGDEMAVRCYNDTGAPITNGQPVYQVGVHSKAPKIAPAGAYIDPERFIGLATENIADKAYGFVTYMGDVHDINTNAFADGDGVFVSATTGTLTAVAPTLPAKRIMVGSVRYANPNGIIRVSPVFDPSHLMVSSVTATSFYGDGASLTSVIHSTAAIVASTAPLASATASNTAGTLVLRDGSGNFSAGTITATKLYGDGSSLTNLPGGGGGVTVATFTFAFHSGGDIYLSSAATPTNNPFPSPGLSKVIDVSTWTITGVRCYTLVTSTVGSSFFNISITTGTTNTKTFNFLFTNDIEVSTNTTYSAWYAPTDSTGISMLAYVPAAIGLHITRIPTAVAMPQEYGCLVKYWRRLDQ